MRQRSRSGLSAMLLVMLAYIMSAISGMGLPGQTLGGHAAAEMLHLPSAARALGAQNASSETAGTDRSDRFEVVAGLADMWSSDPAAVLLLLPTPAQNVAVIAHWLGLLIGWLDQRSRNQSLPWSDAAGQSVVFGQCHRSVVLHI